MRPVTGSLPGAGGGGGGGGPGGGAGAEGGGGGGGGAGVGGGGGGGGGQSALAVGVLEEEAAAGEGVQVRSVDRQAVFAPVGAHVVRLCPTAAHTRQAERPQGASGQRHAYHEVEHVVALLRRAVAVALVRNDGGWGSGGGRGRAERVLGLPGGGGVGGRAAPRRGRLFGGDAAPALTLPDVAVEASGLDRFDRRSSSNPWLHVAVK
eukprot:COSAG04_NODE_1848_length_5409_cov_7.118644_1_plen_206_part_10